MTSPAFDPFLALGEEVIRRADVLRQLSDDPQRYSRIYLTAAHRAAAVQISEWMHAAGMDVRVDGVGNVIGRYEGTEPQAEALLTGSHYDTVRDAGRYDGILGILLPISVISVFYARGERLPYPVEVIAFAEEEGVRFGTSFLASKALIGEFDQGWLDLQDKDGISLRTALLEAGLNPEGPFRSAYEWSRVRAYIEVHIEQGPILLERNVPVGVVTGITGTSNLTIRVTGMAGHAGTVPMRMRRDALAAAAEMILAIEARCANESENLVGTVGDIRVISGANNVVPGEVEFTIDVRSNSDDMRCKATKNIAQYINDIATRRRMRVTVQKSSETNAVECAKPLRERLASAVEHKGLDVVSLPSGAGHDARTLSLRTQVCMLFVRCGNNGISHHPDESLSVADAALAAEVFTNFLRKTSHSD